MTSCLNQSLQSLCPSMTPQALHKMFYSDFRSNSVRCLPKNISKLHNVCLKGAYFLQIESMVNIAANFEQRKTGSGRRVLKFLLSDGHQDVVAWEYKGIHAMSSLLRDKDTTADGLAQFCGLKLVIRDVVILRGHLLLTNENTCILGGGLPHNVVAVPEKSNPDSVTEINSKTRNTPRQLVSNEINQHQIGDNTQTKHGEHKQAEIINVESIPEDSNEEDFDLDDGEWLDDEALDALEKMENNLADSKNSKPVSSPIVLDNSKPISSPIVLDNCRVTLEDKMESNLANNKNSPDSGVALDLGSLKELQENVQQITVRTRASVIKVENFEYEIGSFRLCVWIDDGTAVLPAIMCEDWVSKIIGLNCNAFKVGMSLKEGESLSLQNRAIDGKKNLYDALQNLCGIMEVEAVLNNTGDKEYFVHKILSDEAERDTVASLIEKYM